jgi:hypothetical protein
MDSPILPGRTAEEQSPERQDRYFRWGTKLRLLAATLALVGAVLGVASRLDGSNQTVQYLPSGGVADPQPILPQFGDPTPAALLPAAKSSGQPRTVCTDETRPLPTAGRWTCRFWEPLGTLDIGRRATYTGGPCTHRVVSDTSGSWNCWTRIAIPSIALHMPYAVALMFGHIIASTDGKATSPRVCREEARKSETHGTWTCVGSQGVPAGYRISEPIDPHAPCSYRIVDEATGVWSCQSSAAAQDYGVP